MLEKDQGNGSVGWAQTWITPEPPTDGFYVETVIKEIRENGLDPVQHVKSMLVGDPNNTALITLRRAQKHKARGQQLANIRVKLYGKRTNQLTEGQIERLEREECRLEAVQVYATYPNSESKILDLTEPDRFESDIQDSNSKQN